jgi:hypothetical protein
MATTAKELKDRVSKKSPGFASDVKTGFMGTFPSIFQENTENLSAGEKLKRNISSTPAEKPVETTGIAFGRGAAETIPFAVGLGVAAQFIPAGRAASGAGRVVSGFQNLLNSYGKIFRANPTTTIAGETIAGGFGGATGFNLEKAYPDLPGARLIGELAGGFGVDLAPRVLGMVPSIKVVGELKNWATRQLPSKVRERSAGILAVGDRQRALQSLDQLDVSPGSELTTFTKTKDPTFTRMEQAIIQGSEDGNLPAQLATAVENTNKAMIADVNFGGMSDENIQNTFAGQIEHYRNLLDARLSIAANRARRDISRVAPQSVKESIEPIVKDQLVVALKEAREFEDELYKAIDQEQLVNLNITSVARREAEAALATAQKKNMPTAAKFLDPTSKSYLGDTTSIFELRGVQSELRAEARAARASREQPNFQKAKFADDIADSITEDIANMFIEGDEANVVATAVSFSRELNTRFNQGDVARILRRERTGGDAIDPSMTLTATLGAGKNVNRVAYDRILEATAGNPEVQKSMEEFLKFKFFRGQEFNPKSAQDFLISNSDLLNRMPTFRAEIQDAIRTNNAESLLRSKSEKGTGFLSPAENKAVIYIESGAKRAFESVLTSRTAARDMNNLVRMAKRDNSGEALKGLKTSFSQYLLDKATTRKTNAYGVSVDPFVDGQSLKNIMSDARTKQAIMALYTKEERARLARVARTAELLSNQLAKKAPIELFQQQEMNMFNRAMLRVSGGTLGRKLGTGTLQAPQMGADIMEKLVRGGVIGPERQLLEDAILDEKLFKELLETKTTVSGLPDKPSRAIRAWMAQTLATYGDENIQQEETNTQ